MKTFSANTLLFIVAGYALLTGCKDDEKDTPSPAPTAACRVIKEYITGERDYTLYTYSNNLPATITTFNEVDMPEAIVEVLALQVRRTIPGIHPAETSLHYMSDYLRVSPDQVRVSSTYNNITNTEYMFYLYRYDYKGRMIEVIQSTPHVTNDFEFILTISYDNRDNVTQLLYELYTGPRDQVTVVNVTGYDNHPTPYAGVIGWKYVMANFTWNNHDPLAVILALSKNNPGKYEVFSNGTEHSNSLFTYEYNEKSFPIKRHRLEKAESGEYPSTSEFEYQCN